MKLNRIKFAAAVFTAVFALSQVAVFAQSSITTDTPTTETIIEDKRTLTPKGNAQLVDDVSDNENLQFITVTARDGNVFYFVIDKGAQSENVYFLNTVDESDLEVLVEQSDKKPTASAKPEQPENTTETDLSETDKKDNSDTKAEKSEQPEQNRQKNNSGLFIVLALAAAVGIGGYYYKVILPKKKLEQADDLDDFDFEDEETEIVVNEDNTEDNAE